MRYITLRRSILHAHLTAASISLFLNVFFLSGLIGIIRHWVSTEPCRIVISNTSYRTADDGELLPAERVIRMPRSALSDNFWAERGSWEVWNHITHCAQGLVVLWISLTLLEPRVRSEISQNPLILYIYVHIYIYAYIYNFTAVLCPLHMGWIMLKNQCTPPS